MTYNINKVIILLLFLFIFCEIQAQNVIKESFLDNLEENAKPLWMEDDSAFRNNNVPEKYKDESAVIIGFQRSLVYDKKFHFGLNQKKANLDIIEKSRFKIKLNDRSAVKAFTELYFRYNDKEDGFSVKISKLDGSIEAVPLTTAISVETISEVPVFFKSFFDQELEKRLVEIGYPFGVDRHFKYYKVAVSNLEPGDIVEFISYSKTQWYVDEGYFEFSPSYEICAKAYPILFNRIIVETDNHSFLKSLSLNGAPEFKKVAASDEGFYKYVFNDYDRGVEKDIDFVNDFKLYPLIKFQIVYSRFDNIKGKLNGNPGEIKSKYSKEELVKKIWDDYDKNYWTIRGLAIKNYRELYKLGAKKWSDSEYINNAYYLIRHKIMSFNDYADEKTSIHIFRELLREKDIQSELFICVPKSFGGIENLLFEQEIRYVCKVNNIFYYNFTDHSNPGDLTDELSGTEAYNIAETNKKKKQDFLTIVLPTANAEDNISEYILNVSLDSGMNTLFVSRTNSLTGVSKGKKIDNALMYIPYWQNDYKYYGGDDPTEDMRPARLENFLSRIKERNESLKESKEKLVVANLESEFQQKIKFKSFSVLSDGRSLSSNKLIFKEEFMLTGFVRKAGKKYLVNVPGLTGPQLQVKKQGRVRNHDIEIGYAKKINWVINFKIPEGYTAEGLKELASNVDTETGSYKCNAEILNDTVVVKIQKIYKSASYPKDKWLTMLAFIDEAFNNSFKYILLRPKI